MSDQLELASTMGRAPDLMTLNPWAPWSGDDLKCLPEDAFNRWVAATVRTFHGFGVGKVWGKEGFPAPAKRHIAYADILFFFAEDQASFTSYSKQNHCSEGDSSCGLTVRSLWLLLGARHRFLNPPYEPGTVLEFLRAFAIVSGAFIGDPLKSLDFATTAEGLNILTKDEAEAYKEATPALTWANFNPKPGDTVFLNTPGQHVATIVEILEHTADCLTYISCDGGQQTVKGDEPCCAIHLMKRKAHRKSRTVVTKEGKTEQDWIQDELSTMKHREVTGWSNVKKLPLPAKVITPFRNLGRKALPDPPPFGTHRKNW